MLDASVDQSFIKLTDRTVITIVSNILLHGGFFLIFPEKYPLVTLHSRTISIYSAAIIAYKKVKVGHEG
jgi:hypothetical protein